MTTFHLIDQTPSTSALGDLLALHGATSAVEGDLLVLGPSSLQEARVRLAKLSDAQRGRCLIVGLPETLHVGIPSHENLGGLLDEFLPLGALKFGPDLQRCDVFDFIGKKSLATAMGTPYGTMTASRHYAGYMMHRDEDAGTFALRYLHIATRQNVANEHDAPKALSELATATAELAVMCDREIPDFAATWHAIARNAQALEREPAPLAARADVAALLASIVSLFGHHPGGFTEAYIARANSDEQVAENAKLDSLKERVSAAAGALKQALLEDRS